MTKINNHRFSSGIFLYSTELEVNDLHAWLFRNQQRCLHVVIISLSKQLNNWRNYLAPQDIESARWSTKTYGVTVARTRKRISQDFSRTGEYLVLLFCKHRLLLGMKLFITIWIPGDLNKEQNYHVFFFSFYDNSWIRSEQTKYCLFVNSLLCYQFTG